MLKERIMIWDLYFPCTEDNNIDSYKYIRALAIVGQIYRYSEPEEQTRFHFGAHRRAGNSQTIYGDQHNGLRTYQIALFCSTFNCPNQPHVRLRAHLGKSSR